MKTYNIGIIGLGWISNEFATAMSVVENANLYAVASRNIKKANSFQEKFDAVKAYGSYQELFEDDSVDIVYIGTPMSSHYKNMLDALEHGKHVLCEKSFTLNAKEAKHIKEIAIKKKLFVMEALWTRFNPTMNEILRSIEEGIIGEVESIEVEFSIYRDFDPESRIFSNQLGGGALLDVGIYPITFMDLIMGIKDAEVSSTSKLCETGVDIQDTVSMTKGSVKAELYFGVNRAGENLGIINGTNGTIKVKDFWATQYAEVIQDNQTVDTIELPFACNGLEYQLNHMLERINDGFTESDIMPLSKTIEVMTFMDTLRKEWNVEFITETK